MNFYIPEYVEQEIKNLQDRKWELECLLYDIFAATDEDRVDGPWIPEDLREKVGLLLSSEKIPENLPEWA